MNNLLIVVFFCVTLLRGDWKGDGRNRGVEHNFPRLLQIPILLQPRQNCVVTISENEACIKGCYISFASVLTLWNSSQKSWKQVTALHNSQLLAIDCIDK